MRRGESDILYHWLYELISRAAQPVKMPTVPRWLMIYLTGEGPGPQASFGRRAKTVLAGLPELAEGMGFEPTIRVIAV